MAHCSELKIRVYECHSISSVEIARQVEAIEAIDSQVAPSSDDYWVYNLHRSAYQYKIKILMSSDQGRRKHLKVGGPSPKRGTLPRPFWASKGTSA